VIECKVWLGAFFRARRTPKKSALDLVPVTMGLFAKFSAFFSEEFSINVLTEPTLSSTAPQFGWIL
jgi:hypothetical protein